MVKGGPDGGDGGKGGDVFIEASDKINTFLDLTRTKISAKNGEQGRAVNKVENGQTLFLFHVTTIYDNQTTNYFVI